MIRKINAKSAAFIVLAVLALGVLTASLALNALREYDAVRPVEFCIVPICLALAALRLKESGTDGALLCCALAFTIAADFFMVLLNSGYELSLAFFSCAQLFYWARIQLIRRSGRYTAISACVRIVLSGILCTVAAIIVKNGALLGGLAAFYFVNLTINAAEAFMLCRKNKSYFIFALGLLLFIGCDVCVGLNAAYMAGIKISGGGYYAINLLIWIFYMPSQMLLCLSGVKPESAKKCAPQTEL